MRQLASIVKTIIQNGSWFHPEAPLALATGEDLQEEEEDVVSWPKAGMVRK